MKCEEWRRAGNDNVWRHSLPLMVNSHISAKAMDDFAVGSDISEVIDQTVIRLTQMDVSKRAGKTSGASGSEPELF